MHQARPTNQTRPIGLPRRPEPDWGWSVGAAGPTLAPGGAGTRASERIRTRLAHRTGFRRSRPPRARQVGRSLRVTNRLLARLE
eukprot:11238874-Alexandrium_andersonii.AAC.1